ncbi:MAG: SUMF1/EgtB/PvdO family nonheme iron enzyme [Chitinivibrionales bacterium]|nr:SUMF1/EgtB/PvdO family nonheme iron enzyme [Chitinivibrionales bacterium]
MHEEPAMSMLKQHTPKCHKKQMNPTTKIYADEQVSTAIISGLKIRGLAVLLVNAILLISLISFPARGQDSTDMIYVKGGEFMMGSTIYTRETDQAPLHKVGLSSFYLDKCEVTQVDYQKSMLNNPSLNNLCPTCPAERVTWYEARAYCEKLGKRLPTEAEFEYALKAGATTMYPWGQAPDSADAWAWHAGNSNQKTHPCGRKKANAFGLHDMTGNVWEWVGDYYDKDYYRNSPSRNPHGPDRGKYRSIRGGGYTSGPQALLPTARDRCLPDRRRAFIGFRCAKDVGGENELQAPMSR